MRIGNIGFLFFLDNQMKFQNQQYKVQEIGMREKWLRNQMLTFDDTKFVEKNKLFFFWCASAMNYERLQSYTLLGYELSKICCCQLSQSAQTVCNSVSVQVLHQLVLKCYGCAWRYSLLIPIFDNKGSMTEKLKSMGLKWDQGRGEEERGPMGQPSRY